MPRTTGERKDLNWSMKMSPQEMAYLEQRKQQLNYTSMSDTLRDLLTAFRTWFQLPKYMADRLEADRATKGMDVVPYIQQVLALHAETVGRESASAPTSSQKAKPGKHG